ncbi:hypothetical protein BSKO_08042 [Bryopsis sp. KO-2023]|nr:hypothetical protein BSKO_08042 [Bryopsis sp. KO-2023]
MALMRQLDDLSDSYETARGEFSEDDDVYLGAGQFFDHSVDDTELPSALETMRTFRRPRHVSKEELDTEVMELWKSLNQGILQNHNLGSTIEDLRTQLHVAKSDIRALEEALERSEIERADVENRLHSANRRLDEVENDAMASRSSIMAVGGEGGSLEGLPQVGETLEVEKAESVKPNRSAGSSLLDAESGGVQGTTKWWRNSWVHGVAIIGIVMFAIKKL